MCARLMREGFPEGLGEAKMIPMLSDRLEKKRAPSRSSAAFPGSGSRLGASMHHITAYAHHGDANHIGLYVCTDF